MRQSGMFVVGGLMGRGPAIFELDRRWESLRKRADIDIEYFKASQCERGTKQFSKFVADPDDIQPTERDRLDSISFEFLNAIVNPQFVEKNIILFEGASPRTISTVLFKTLTPALSWVPALTVWLTI